MQQHFLIVGASRGLGLSLTQAVLQRGSRVSAIVNGAAPLLAPLADEHPGQFELFQADVRSELGLAQAASKLEQLPRLDTLIYNAAIHLEHEQLDIESAAIDAMLETLDVNAVGAARTLKHFRKCLAPGGRVVLVSSEAASIGNAGRTSEYGYCMSKAALNMLGKLLANRERTLGTGVQVLSVHPGWMRTDMGGPRADISAPEAADDLLALLDRRTSTRDPPFVDRLGNPLPW